MARNSSLDVRRTKRRIGCMGCRLRDMSCRIASVHTEPAVDQHEPEVASRVCSNGNDELDSGGYCSDGFADGGRWYGIHLPHKEHDIDHILHRYDSASGRCDCTFRVGVRRPWHTSDVVTSEHHRLFEQCSYHRSRCSDESMGDRSYRALDI